MFARILSLQGVLIVLVLIGVIARKKGVLKGESKSVLTDLLINIIIPCNVIHSFTGKYDTSVLYKLLIVFGIAIFMHIITILSNKFLYNSQELEKQKVLKYMTVISNAGFMGVAIIDGIYGQEGLMYSSVALISQRALLWTVGLAYFTEVESKKELAKKILLHPCLVAVYIGFIIMITGIELPEFLGKSIKSVGGTTLSISMILIGLILGETKELKGFFTKLVLYFSGIRLILMPLIAFLVGKALNLDPIILGVQVIISGMPGGSTGAILASKYNGDTDFATKCIVVSSLLSLITIPVWCIFLKI